MGSSGFETGLGTVILDGTNDVLLSAVAEQNFYNLTIDKASAADFVNLLGSANIAMDMVVNS